MRFIHIEGHITKQSFENVCGNEKLDPKRVVFLFPGNASHHQEVTLFTIKHGDGLAKAAKEIGEAGYPTLSLPTTGMENFALDPHVKAIVYQAIADIFYAVGQGYSVMLPVRCHEDTTYFDTPLNFIRQNDKSVEPNFWGGVQLTANKPLAFFYTKILGFLHYFIMELDANGRKHFLDKAKSSFFNFCYQAYLCGRAGEDNVSSAVLFPISPSPFRAISSENESTLHASEGRNPSADSEKLASDKRHLQTAKRLLNDYTKGNSRWLRFFTGHWNRHHLQAVSAIVAEMDNGRIVEKDELIDRLKRITLINEQGSLAKRIKSIEDLFKREQEQLSP